MFGGGFFGGGGPFGGMPGMGGPKKSDNTRYYTILNVDRNASDAEIKKAHRKLALKHHPDKGGAEDKFKEINEAYDVLRDPEKRKLYDEYGEDAVKDGAGGGGPSGNMSDIFEMFSGGRARQRGPPKGEDVVHKLKVSLDEMYTGGSRKLSLTRKIKCDGCNGAGTKSGKRYPCESCNGTGVQVSLRPLGPGMMQQISQPCSNCRATGFAVPQHDLCNKCKGDGLVPEKKVFEVHVEPGHRHGAKIVLRGEAGQTDPNTLPGDVVFLLEQKEHPVFTRIAADLLIKKKISLVEALTGVSFQIKHLDGRILEVNTRPGEIIKPDSYHCINDEGMPIHGHPLDKGNLYVHFDVVFPDMLSSEQIAMLRTCLPPPGIGENGVGSEMSDYIEQVNMRSITDFETELKQRRAYQRAQASGPSYNSDDEDDEEGGPRQRVQCAQQ